MPFVAAILSTLFVLAITWKPFFGNKDGFLECVRYFLTPDFIDSLRGERADNFWAEMKILVWLGLAIAIGIGVYFKVD